jgi:glycosyltransferase involved in cell wall biosynthesis
MAESFKAADPFKVLVGWTDRGASGLLRGVTPLRFLKDRLSANGVEVFLHDRPTFGDRADAVVVRGNLIEEGVLWVLGLKARGTRVAVNFDDDLWNVPRSSPAYDPGVRDSLANTLFLADFVWASTGPLAKRVREEGFTGPVRVLPNLLDAEAFPAQVPADPEDPVRVLWYGSVTHRPDLDMIAHELAGVMERLRGEAELVLWGDQQPELVRRLWGRNLTLQPWGTLEKFPSRLVGFKPSVSLCPLDGDDPFNWSKSALKFFESSLAGAACVCSKSGPFPAVVRHAETGLLADYPEEWGDFITDLVRDKGLRGCLARAARDDVLANHTWQHSPAAREWEAAFLELKG